MIFKVIIVSAGIYWLYRKYITPSIESPKDNINDDDFTDYEEID